MKFAAFSAVTVSSMAAHASLSIAIRGCIELCDDFVGCYHGHAFMEGHRKMRTQIAAVLCSAVVGMIAMLPVAIAQSKTTKACMEEWRVNKAAEGNGVTERAYVARCRAGRAPIRTGGASASSPNLSAVVIPAVIARSIYRPRRSWSRSSDPSADALWGAVGTVVDKDGIHELSRSTQEEWLDVPGALGDLRRA
jgi:hypothetical protein